MTERASQRGVLVPQGTIGAAMAVVKRPDLWIVALRTAASMTPRRWWAHPPFLPLPDRGWMAFRLETAYGGDARGPVRAEDLITYLEWRRRF
ncbi:MAG: hypothetical protein O3C27_09455 [Actinomycetota bacterium]|nr:hypothetical protein [Actinomycetota bacterium]